jgi:membrane associated rhomboid family serine protease
LKLRISWFFAFAIVATWFGALAIGVDATAPTASELIGVGGNYGPRTWGGEWWRLCTAATVHAGWLHLAINAVLIVGLGSVLEARRGAARW